MSKFVVDALQFGMMARICAEANPELTEEQLMADATPLPASAQFAGEMAVLLVAMNAQMQYRVFASGSGSVDTPDEAMPEVMAEMKRLLAKIKAAKEVDR
jgi:hypothetical protein